MTRADPAFRLELFPDGLLVDELVAGPGKLTVELTGVARYSIGFEYDGGRRLEVRLWTSKHGHIEIRWLNSLPEDRVTLRAGSDDIVDCLVAEDCCIHLEHLDRGHYFLGVGQAGDSYGLCFWTRGYLRTQFLELIQNDVTAGEAGSATPAGADSFR